MKNFLFYPVGSTKACRYATDYLCKRGIPLVDHPTPEVTHLLLDVPSFQADGALRDGTDPLRILERVPKSVVVIGGYLNHPLLKDYKIIDLLQNEHYLASNAAITADCAIRLSFSYFDCAFSDFHVLITGWGRIGKCLAKHLKDLSVPVTVAVRKDSDHAMLQALGYRAIYLSQVPSQLCAFRMLFNTIPSPVLTQDVSDKHPDIYKIDLASCSGIEGNDVIQARGLPGRYAPKSSGQLIANTILQLL